MSYLDQINRFTQGLIAQGLVNQVTQSSPLFEFIRLAAGMPCLTRNRWAMLKGKRFQFTQDASQIITSRWAQFLMERLG